MIQIQNEYLSVEFREKGAEIISIYSKKTDIEYLWQGDPLIWAKYSPILFPIIGRLKDGEYYIDDTKYKMNVHGFASEMNFDIIHRSSNRIVFYLTYDDETIMQYPYKFHLEVSYELIYNTINVQYTVKNIDDGSIYFSIGGHPAFNCPLFKNESVEDYYLEFDVEKDIESYIVSNETKLIKNSKFLVSRAIKNLYLRTELFNNDTLIFDNFHPKRLCLKSKNHNHSITMEFEEFPYVAIWAKKKNGLLSGFLCIEPWFGIPDFEHTSKILKEKAGIIELDEKETFECKYVIGIK